MKPIKKRLSLLFLIGFVLLSLMILLQTFSNKYSDLTFVAWIWLIFLYIPPLLFLNKSSGTAKNSSLLPLTTLTILFIITSFLGVLLQPLALNAWGTDAGVYITRIRTLTSSLYFLIPLELLILYLIRKNFKKEPDSFPIPESLTVFISYNHNDYEVAQKIQQKLESASIEVIIDHEDMQSGENIEKFIEDSIMASTVTISLISNTSLSSGWVAMETIDTFFLERFFKHRKFIACYLEDDFFNDRYIAETVKKIDMQIEKKLKYKSEQDGLGIDSRNLNTEITRLRKLRHNLDHIISRLKDSLCLDISEQNFEASINRLMKDIKLWD
ncbi:MAG: hypothetical protein COA50_11740 [Flavobacteriaceae bacterium]|nr:MAG: hypothetical protein COA50_11740 [Flavobacteriaceae bacterium]